MPTGPQGQKRPADAVSRAVHIGKIATGEIEEIASREPRGQAGGVARAASLSAERRTEIASASAGTRWNANDRRERAMTTPTKCGTSVAEGSALRMYPNNTLGKQYRDVSETLSIFEVSAKHFHAKK